MSMKIVPFLAFAALGLAAAFGATSNNPARGAKAAGCCCGDQGACEACDCDNAGACCGGESCACASCAAPSTAETPVVPVAPAAPAAPVKSDACCGGGGCCAK